MQIEKKWLEGVWPPKKLERISFQIIKRKVQFNVALDCSQCYFIVAVQSKFYPFEELVTDKQRWDISNKVLFDYKLRQIQPVRSKMSGNSLWISQNSGKIQPVQSKIAGYSLWISQFTQQTLTSHSWPVFVCSRVASAAARMFSEENSGGCGASGTRSVIWARQTEIM